MRFQGSKSLLPMRLQVALARCLSRDNRPHSVPSQTVSSSSVLPLWSIPQTSSSRCWSICWVLCFCFGTICCRLRPFHRGMWRRWCELHHSTDLRSKEGYKHRRLVGLAKNENCMGRAEMVTSKSLGQDRWRGSNRNLIEEKTAAGPHRLQKNGDPSSRTPSDRPYTGGSKPPPCSAIPATGSLTAETPLLLSFSANLDDSTFLCLSASRLALYLLHSFLTQIITSSSQASQTSTTKSVLVCVDLHLCLPLYLKFRTYVSLHAFNSLKYSQLSELVYGYVCVRLHPLNDPFKPSLHTSEDTALNQHPDWEAA